MAAKVGSTVNYVMTPDQAAGIFHGHIITVNHDGTFAIQLTVPPIGELSEDTNDPPAPGKFVLAPAV